MTSTEESLFTRKGSNVPGQPSDKAAVLQKGKLPCPEEALILRILDNNNGVVLLELRGPKIDRKGYEKLVCDLDRRTGALGLEREAKQDNDA